MSKQKHSMQPKPSHDESVRQDFVTDLRAYLTDEIYSLITPHYEKKIKPDFIQTNESILIHNFLHLSWKYYGIFGL